MAETVVSTVLLKLADTAIQEAILHYRVKDKVELVKRDLISIQCFLKDADSNRKGDYRVQNWVKQVRDMSYWIEDVIDTYLADVWRIDIGSNKLHKKAMKLIFKHKLGKAIDKIQARIKEIYTSREIYGIKNLGESSQEPINPLGRPIVIPNDDIEIVGLDGEKNDIINMLLDGSTLKRRVVSIVGQGGLGKTTLAKKVYNSAEVNDQFDCRMWLTVSQEIKSTELLKDVLRKLIWWVTVNDENDRDVEYFASEINKLLKDQRYLIILDDIWGDNAWSDLLEPSFPDIKNGSRVLITTRFLNVAKRADHEGVYELRLLNEEESRELLMKKAIPNHDNNKNYPLDLFELAKEFVKICDGLPLALVVVGGLLSIKPPNYNAWQRVLKTMDWHGDGNKCMKIIATSYEDLPLLLKPCFLYLSVFPEDYEIEADFLIQLWVAEGLIPDEPGKIMEDTSRNYLDELAQRCMIQVLTRSNMDGCVTKFRVHDLLRELAIHEANEKEFSKVFSKEADFQITNVARRRAIFQLKEGSRWADETKLMKYTNQNIHSLFFFDNVILLDSRLKLLRVLVVEYCSENHNSDWRNNLKLLLHLRCVKFKKCEFRNKFILPVDHWHNLQTLEIDNCEHMVVPKSLWGIKSMRHVSVFGNTLELVSTNSPILQTLIVTQKSIIGLLNVPNLRRLYLVTESDSNGDAILSLLAKCEFLISVTLKIPKFPVDITFSGCSCLSELVLYGLWPMDVVLNEDTFPPHLTRLELCKSRIGPKLIGVLEKLQNLEFLSLSENACVGEKIIFSKRGFCHLKQLSLENLDDLKELEIEEGALPVLKKLEIMNCKKLRELPQNLQHVEDRRILYKVAECVGKSIIFYP